MRNNKSQFSFILMAALTLSIMLMVPSASNAAATLIIVNGNAAGVGFNDPTPSAPVGGNPGTTLGQQRLIAFQQAASLWGAQLNSAVPITVLATFEPLSCNASSAVLGSAGPTEVWSFASGAPILNEWYHFALANKLAGVDLDPATAQIRARFNSNLGNAGCLTGFPFYLGLDSNHGTAIDLVTVLLHEFSHGLGFSTTTNSTTGALLGGFPSVYDHFAYDLTAGKYWDQMNSAERVTSAINPRKLVWAGANVAAGVPQVLSAGTPVLSVTSPPSYGATGTYNVGTASFGPQLSSPGITGQIMPISTPASGAACNPLAGADALAANGNIALIDRGICTFPVKVKNAQNAGAIGVIIADNAAGAPPAGLGGADPTIAIPSARISLSDAIILKNALRFRSRTRSGVAGTLGVDAGIYAGADSVGRALLFTPNPFQSGSSVSHFDTIAFPNLLMEPNINGDLTHNLFLPWDLTLQLFLDIGW
jgi:hypothetical protein